MEEANMAENYSGDVTATTDTPSVENQTANDDFLAGFSDEKQADEQAPEESDSKGKSEEAEDNINQKENQPEDQSHSRPDRNTRSRMRINQILAESRAREEENARLRAQLAERNAPKLNTDEDGNATIEDVAEYNKQLIQQEMERHQFESEQRIAEAERARDLDNSIYTIRQGIADRVAKYDFLNPNKQDVYDPNAESIISQMVLDEIERLQISGLTDYSAMADYALSAIDRQIELYQAAAENAKLSATQNLDEMANGGAISSSLTGDPTLTKTDDFLEGFQ